VLYVAMIAVAAACWLWIRMFRTPPDASARRRLMDELRAHNADLWEDDDLP